MKKFTYFMLAAASWMFAMPASAFDVETTPTQASALTDGYYVLKTHGKALTGYLHHDLNYVSNRPFTQTVNFDPATSTDLNYVFHLVKDASTGTFTLQCVGTNGYMPHDSQRGQNFNTSATEANAAKFQTQAIPEGAVGEILDGGVLLYDTRFTPTSTGDQYYVHFNMAVGREANCSYWDGGGMTAADHTVVEFAFYKVNVNGEPIDVTYNMPDGTTTTGKAFSGSEASAPSTSRPANMSYYYGATITNEDKIVSETNNTFNVTYAKGDNVPFEFSTDESETWYTMNVRQAGYYLVVDDASSTDVHSRSNVTVDNILNGNADWKFVESGYGVKLANKTTGKYIQTPSTNNKATFVDADQATEFVVIQNGSGFSLKLPGTSFCMGDHCSTFLGTWANNNSTTDGGSRFTVANSLAAVQTTIDTQVEAAKAAADESLLGHYNAEDVNVIALAKDNAKDLNDYIAINDKLKNLASVSTPEADAYYQIINVNVNTGYVTTEPITVGTDGVATEAQNIKRVAIANHAIVPTLWQFEASGEGYKIVNANTGRAFSAVENVAVAIQDVDKSEAGVITLQQLSSKVQFMLKSGDHRINAIYGVNGTELADYSGNHDGDAGNYWKIKKVTTIPVTISNANYATVGFPFAVTIPEGVKAFIGTSTDNAQLELTEIEGGVIPANTGAIIYHDGATTANFDITSATTTIDNNVLTATTAKRAGFEADGTYVLALDGEGKAAFLQSELTTVPANKAFLLTSKVSSSTAGALAFNFGGNTTGINNAVATEGADTKYFDLQGRQVLYPSNGIFVTNKGKKVFIK